MQNNAEPKPAPDARWGRMAVEESSCARGSREAASHAGSIGLKPDNDDDHP